MKRQKNQIKEVMLVLPVENYFKALFRKGITGSGSRTKRTGLYASLKKTPSFARRSMLGVL